MEDGAVEIYLVRHGETEWSLSGQHTGKTDIPLTAAGERGAQAAGRALAGLEFTLVLSSPLSRAVETCRLAGFGDRAQLRDDLVEWDYGDYDGRTTADIRKDRPGWALWRDGVPGGETADQVGARADRVIAEAVAAGGRTLMFAHGHILRVLTARWLGLDADGGRLFVLEPATISILGYERETRVIRRWNVTTG
jgi:broad specificity phosphatase PhoE